MSLGLLIHVLFSVFFISVPFLSHCALVVRKLQEFELPYVSVTSLRNPDYHIVLRKRYAMTSVCHGACLLYALLVLVNHFARVMFTAVTVMLSHHTL